MTFERQTCVADSIPTGQRTTTCPVGALTIFGPAVGLRDPVASGHNGYGY